MAGLVYAGPMKPFAATAALLSGATLAVLAGTVWPNRLQTVSSMELLPEARRLVAAAESGDSGAQVALGNAYDGGQLLARDVRQAMRWYRRAATQGNVDAQTSLGLLYLDGDSVPRDARLAAAWLRRAAEQESAFAQYTLAEILESGDEGVRARPLEAVDWYRRAAEQGYGPAQLSLGRLFEDGRDVPRDLRQAASWYRRAADQDLVEAQIRLGSLYRRAELGPDLVEAHVWLNLAASRFKSTDQFATASRMRDEVARSLDEAQLLEAFRRATAWQDTVGMAGR